MRVLKEIHFYKKKDPSRKEIINAMELLTHYTVPMFTGNIFSTSFFNRTEFERDRCPFRTDLFVMPIVTSFANIGVVSKMSSDNLN